MLVFSGVYNRENGGWRVVVGVLLEKVEGILFSDAASVGCET